MQLRCGLCSGILCEVTDCCFFEKSEKEVHLILRPELPALPGSILISSNCNRKGIADASCGACSSRVGHKLPFGPRRWDFVAFGSDKVSLFGIYLGEKALWAQALRHGHFGSIERRNSITFFENGVPQVAFARMASKDADGGRNALVNTSGLAVATLDGNAQPMGQALQNSVPAVPPRSAPIGGDVVVPQRSSPRVGYGARAGSNDSPSWGRCQSVEPSSVLYSHARISHSFRNGTRIDDAIEAIRVGDVKVCDFPPLHVVEIGGKMVAIRGNRRPDCLIAKVDGLG